MQQLKAGQSQFFIVEIEFYFLWQTYSTSAFGDSMLKRQKQRRKPFRIYRQREFGELYFH